MIKPGSKLLRKGLLVIILPMVFQLIFHTVLAISLFQAEQEIQRIVESKKVVSAATGVVTRLIDCELLALFYNANHLPFLEMKFMEEKRKSELACTELIKLAKGDKKRAEYAERIKTSSYRTLNRLADMFTEEFDQEIEVNKYVNTDVRIDKVYDFFTLTFKNVDELLEQEQKKQQNISKNQRYFQTKIKNIILGGVTMNVILTILLAIFLTLSTTGRLKTVLDNTRRLIKREPLAPPIGGNDEITQLDTVFHATANDLARVDRQRKQLVSLVRNELSRPLSKVQYSLHNLSHGILGELTDKAQSRLTMAAMDTDRVVRLIDDLLSIEDMEGASFDLVFKATNSEDIISSATASVKQLADRSSISLEAMDDKIDLMADKDRLVQVLINFLSNAIKFSPENSTITIKAERIKEGDQHEAVFKVIDRGRGIPADKKDLVFERFKQVDEGDQVDKGGTGLGLPISKTIVEQHDGLIGVDSTPGEGSTFWFRLPLDN